MAVKLASMTEAQIGSIVEAFADYQYEGGEQGLFYLFPDKEAVRAYMSAFVRPGFAGVYQGRFESIWVQRVYFLYKSTKERWEIT